MTQFMGQCSLHAWNLRLAVTPAALGHAESASAAAMAFRDLCKACGARLGPHLEALTHLYQSVQSTGAMAAAAASATVDEDDVQQVYDKTVAKTSQATPCSLGSIHSQS